MTELIDRNSRAVVMKLGLHEDSRKIGKGLRGSRRKDTSTVILKTQDCSSLALRLTICKGNDKDESAEASALYRRAFHGEAVQY